MGFSEAMLRGGAGEIDHRLARRALINEVKKGRVSRDSVCDAHPELIRAARNIGEATDTVCPICEKSKVALVTYVFGHGLPAHGKCVVERSDIERIQATGHDHVAYVVEACPDCRWHHLLRVLAVPGKRASRRAAR